MPQFRVTITKSSDPSDKPVQLFAPTEEQAREELKKWSEKGHKGKYRITRSQEVVVEEGEC